MDRVGSSNMEQYIHPILGAQDCPNDETLSEVQFEVVIRGAVAMHSKVLRLFNPAVHEN